MGEGGNLCFKNKAWDCPDHTLINILINNKNHAYHGILTRNISLLPVKIRVGGSVFFLIPSGGPNQTSFLNLRGKSNFINVINKKYQRNVKRHGNKFLPNLFIAPVGGFNPAVKT